MISETNFGTLYGVDVKKYRLENKNGFSASIINYGATITDIEYNGVNVVLGYKDLDGYLKGTCYFGATVGRYANRIAGGKFTLDGEEYDIGANEKGVNHLHGGYIGFDKQLWDAVKCTEGDEPSITFEHIFDDMEEGYPGELWVNVTFTVTADNTLKIEYEAEVSKNTVINLTNHSYFNLNGDVNSVEDTYLKIFADRYTPLNKNQIPTGEIASVDGTPFDFREGKKIGKDIDADDEQIKIGAGFDHNLIFSDNEYNVKATAKGNKSGIVLEMKTTEPAVQLYTGGWIKPGESRGGNLVPKCGFCLETQHYPDSPNNPVFPSTVLKAGEKFYSKTEYNFSL